MMKFTADQLPVAMQVATVVLLLALNVQFFLTFGLNKSIPVIGWVTVDGEVATRPVEGASDASLEDTLRKVLSDCKLSADLGMRSVSEANMLELRCDPPVEPQFPMPPPRTSPSVPSGERPSLFDLLPAQ